MEEYIFHRYKIDAIWFFNLIFIIYIAIYVLKIIKTNK